MKKLTESRLIFLFAAIIIISILSIISAISIYHGNETLLVEEKGKKAMSVSITVEKLIEQDYNSFHKLVKTDDYSAGNYDEGYYIKMQQIFRDIREETGVRFLYCAKRVSDNRIIYLFDGEDPDSELFSPLGSMDHLDEFEQSIYRSKIPGYTPVVDTSEWGQVITGMTPVIDPATGDAVAHIGVDVSVKSVHTALAGVKKVITFNTIFFIIITSLIIYRLLSTSLIFTEIDYLTGLHSKAYQERFLNQLIKKSIANGRKFSLIMIDFDDFKIINDQYGHQFGDVVMKNVAEIIKNCSRSIDCSARYGGDEFVIILPEASLEYTSLIGQWLMKEVTGLNLKTKNGTAVPVSISVGIAEWEKNMTAEQIMIQADKALYHSKRSGKNQLVVYSKELELQPEILV